VSTHHPLNHQPELRRAFDQAELTIHEIWLRYFTLGGDAGPLEIDAYLNSVMPLSPFQHNILALAVNERLNELPPPQAPYYETPLASSSGSDQP
jgi:hypothetical protein